MTQSGTAWQHCSAPHVQSQECVSGQLYCSVFVSPANTWVGIIHRNSQKVTPKSRSKHMWPSLSTCGCKKGYSIKISTLACDLQSEHKASPASHWAMIHGTASVRVGSNGGGDVLNNAHLDAGPPEGHCGIFAKDGLPLLKSQCILGPGCVKQHLLSLRHASTPGGPLSLFSKEIDSRPCRHAQMQRHVTVVQGKPELQQQHRSQAIVTQLLAVTMLTAKHTTHSSNDRGLHYVAMLHSPRHRTARHQCHWQRQPGRCPLQSHTHTHSCPSAAGGMHCSTAWWSAPHARGSLP